MKLLLLLSLLFPPVASADDHYMSCDHVNEVAEVVLEAPGLSNKKKKQILLNLIGKHGLECINSRDAHD